MINYEAVPSFLILEVSYFVPSSKLLSPRHKHPFDNGRLYLDRCVYPKYQPNHHEKKTSKIIPIFEPRE